MGRAGKKQRWRDLRPGQRRALSVVSAVEVALTLRALVDLAKRPAAQVRGSKVWWALACFVQPIGPIAYLRLGRRGA